jgi:hypothetical protein
VPAYAPAPELEGRGDLYLEDRHVAEVDDAENAPHGVRSYAIDPGVAQQLWVVAGGAFTLKEARKPCSSRKAPHPLSKLALSRANRA